jgi:hypothetical protein
VQFANFRSDRGSAVLEFAAFGLLLQVPVLAWSVSLITLQHDQLAAEAISREAARSFVLVNRDPAVTASEVASAYRVASDRVQVLVSCQFDDCFSERSWIQVTTRVGSALARASAQR